MGIQEKIIGMCILFFLVVALAIAAPPTPKSISGYIYHNEGTQVPLGTSYSVNNTNSTFYFKDVTSSPATGKSGYYSVRLEGNEGDDAHILAWNKTAFAEQNVSLSGSMTLDLYLNKTRPPEINLSITYPENDTLFNVTNNFDFNVTINVMGGINAENCTFAISFNSSVLALRAGETLTHNYSTLTYGSTFIETWNFTALANGSSKMSVNATCDTDWRILDDLTMDTASNILVNATGVPTLYIVAPQNNTQNISSNEIFFVYNYSNDSPATNCTLFVNGIYKNHTDTPTADTEYTLATTLTNGGYNWTINCTAGSTGTAGRYNLSVAVHYPYVSLIQIDNQVNLLTGSNKELSCNGTVTDENGFTDISSVNATLYYLNGGFSADDSDDNNSHYFIDCTTSNGIGNDLDFNCIFNITYFAPAGEWQCNVSITDAEYHVNTSTIDTNVSELYAISLPTELDYGVLIPNQISDEKETIIENQGNVNINISVRGYGEYDADNLSMICERGNISVNAQKFNSTIGAEYTEMRNLSDDFAKVLTISKSTGTTSQDSLYWRINPGFGLGGTCNGTIIFSVVVE